MPKLIILGDVHGKFDLANATVQDALKRHPTASMVVQMGDLGDGWPTQAGPARWQPDFNLPIYVVDGNHENFDAIENGDVNPRLRWMPRGSIKNLDGRNAMFFGGATTPDKALRTIGLTWWPQESITVRQVNRALTRKKRIDFMFTHERASVFPIPEKYIDMYSLFPPNLGTADREGLSDIWRKFRPMNYFHGHWHWGSDQHIHGTRVISCPVVEDVINWTVFDTKTLEVFKNW